MPCTSLRVIAILTLAEPLYPDTIFILINHAGTLQRAERSRDKSDDKADQGTNLSGLGLKLAPANAVSGAGKEGVVVTDIDDSGPAAERGIKAGDVILEAGGKHVSAPSDIRDAIGTARKDGKSVILLRLKNSQGNHFVTLPVKNG